VIVTVVTGASSGIGRSLARRLAGGGDPLGLLARRGDLLNDLVAEIEAQGGRALAVPCDVTDREQVKAALARVEMEFGPVERLVVNAGGGKATEVDPFDAEHVAAILELNVMGAVHCLEAVLPGMLERGRGQLVAMSSLAAYRGLPGGGAYSAAKAALTNLMESLRVDLRPRGIDVTVLLPGFVRAHPGSAIKRKSKPLRLDLEVATERMERAIRARRSRDAFPLPVVMLAGFARLLPAVLYDWLASRLARRSTEAKQAEKVAEKPKGRRRIFVKKLGKKLLRGPILEYLARRSLVPNDPVIGNEYFPWADEFCAHWIEIRRELAIQLRNRTELPSFQDISGDQYRISPDDRWKTFVFVGFGDHSALAHELCPETARALSLVPKLETAFFSILAPGKHVPRHRGVTKGMVRGHLSLLVPKESTQCWMDCGDDRIEWREGELVFFDDTYPHAVWNDTNEERAVLLFDFERPMTRRAQWLSRLTIWLLRRTAYFKDARRNQRAWEERYRKVLARQTT
jgi:ornithine lipid ester-linked acyl 2-hydroxylase